MAQLAKQSAMKEQCRSPSTFARGPYLDEGADLQHEVRELLSLHYTHSGGGRHVSPIEAADSLPCALRLLDGLRARPS